MGTDVSSFFPRVPSFLYSLSSRGASSTETLREPSAERREGLFDFQTSHECLLSVAQSAALHWHGQLTPTPRTHQHNYAVWSDQLGGQFQTTYRGYSEMKGSLKDTWARLGSATYCHHQRPPYEKGNDMDRPYKSWGATIFHAQSDSVLGLLEVGQARYSPSDPFYRLETRSSEERCIF